jgi:hypothetical protein
MGWFRIEPIGFCPSMCGHFMEIIYGIIWHKVHIKHTNLSLCIYMYIYIFTYDTIWQQLGGFTSSTDGPNEHLNWHVASKRLCLQHVSTIKCQYYIYIYNFNDVYIHNIYNMYIFYNIFMRYMYIVSIYIYVCINFVVHCQSPTNLLSWCCSSLAPAEGDHHRCTKHSQNWETNQSITNLWLLIIN